MAQAPEAFVNSIVKGLAREEPTVRVARKTAAVAVVFRRVSDVEEFLLIKRAEREGDPWSGQVAFPGGRVEPGDSNFMETATREAREEVGVNLDADALFLGYMRPFRARTRDILVVPSVFSLKREIVVVCSDREVSSHQWISFRELLTAENRSTYTFEYGGAKQTHPSFSLNGYAVWGLTERILSTLVDYAAEKKEKD